MRRRARTAFSAFPLSPLPICASLPRLLRTGEILNGLWERKETVKRKKERRVSRGSLHTCFHSSIIRGDSWWRRPKCPGGGGLSALSSREILACAITQMNCGATMEKKTLEFTSLTSPKDSSVLNAIDPEGAILSGGCT